MFRYIRTLVDQFGVECYADLSREGPLVSLRDLCHVLGGHHGVAPRCISLQAGDYAQTTICSSCFQ